MDAKTRVALLQLAQDIEKWSIRDGTKCMDDFAARLRALTPAETGGSDWRLMFEERPAPHAKYLVRRGGYVFTATPCYGLHAPWWVVMTMDGEVDPEPMNDQDEWKPLVESEEQSAKT